MDFDGSVIEYADLTPDQQAFFEQAVADGELLTKVPDDVNRSVWYEYDAVRYENRTYQVEMVVS